MNTQIENLDGTKEYKRKFWATFIRKRESLRKWFSFTTDLAKSITLISIPLGLFLLTSYLGAIGSPMLTPDASTIFTLLIIVASYGFIALFIIIIITMPMFTCNIKPRVRSYIKTSDYRNTNGTSRSLFRFGLFKHRKRKNDFVLFHGTTFFALISLVLSSLFKFELSAIIILILISSGLGLYISLMHYRLNEDISSWKKFHRRYFIGRFRNIAQRTIIIGGIVRAFIAVVWVTAIYGLISRNEVFTSSTIGTAYIEVFYLSTMLVIYFLFTHVNVIATRIPFAMLLLAFLFAIYFPSYSGGLALRVLGMGGGIPISIVVKTMLPGSKDIVAVVKPGCLILKSAFEVIVKSDDNPTLGTCHAGLSELLQTSNQIRPQIFNQVDVFPFSQVVQVRKLP